MKLIEAVENNDLNEVRKLLGYVKKFTNENPQGVFSREGHIKNNKVNSTDEEGNTALMYASYNGNREIVELLIENGADIDHENNDGNTALMWATNGEKNTETIK